MLHFCPGVLERVLADRQWTHRDLARAMGVSASQVNRVLNGKRQPGRKFIDGCLQLGLKFDDLWRND